MSAKHTPGPWKIDREWMDGEWRQVVSEWDEKFIRFSIAGNVGEANARLIAAAPELLDALIWHRDALDLGDVAFYENHGFNVAEVMPRTRAAIAKATGQDAQA